jgi:hypothetical protein
MGRVVLRFQSLVLREDGNRSTIHFEAEDDDAITCSRATIVERSPDEIEVGAPQGYAGVIDAIAFAAIVRRIYGERRGVIDRLDAMAHASCIVALEDMKVAMEDRAAVA